MHVGGAEAVRDEPAQPETDYGWPNDRRTASHNVLATEDEKSEPMKLDRDSVVPSELVVYDDSSVDHSTKETNPPSAMDDKEAQRPGQQPDAPVHSIFPRRMHIFIIVMAAACGLISPLSGNIYFPALNPLSRDLHVSSSLINVSLTTYMIVQGLTPSLMGNFADTTGRRPAYLIGFTIYIGACIGLALQTSYPALLILRCLQASGSSSTIALSSAIVADVSTAAERGTYMGWISGGALVGPALGPVLGGILAQFLGWRAIFWFLAILAGVLMIPLIVVFPETCRNVVGNGSIPPQRWNQNLISVIRQRRRRQDVQQNQSGEDVKPKRQVRFPNPLSTFRILREKDVALLLLYNCLVYAAYYSVTSSLPYLFSKTYDFNELQVGLSFIPCGCGALLASLFNGRIMDWRFQQVAKSLDIEIVKGRNMDTRNFPLERVRLPIVVVLILIGNTTLLCYGWVSYRI
jgi:multidrug resistance protein